MTGILVQIQLHGAHVMRALAWHSFHSTFHFFEQLLHDLAVLRWCVDIMLFVPIGW